MAGTKTYNSDLNLLGRLAVSDVPNATGTILTYNSTSKEISTRTYAEIISDLGLNTGLTGYVKKTGDTMSGALTFGNSSAWMIKKDLSTITSASGFARDMFQLIGTNGIIDVMGWQGSVDSSGNVTIGYGYLGGSAYNSTNALRWNSLGQIVVGGTFAPTAEGYIIDIVGNSRTRGSVNAWGIFNTTSGELQVQRLGVNRIRTNTNSLILSGDQSNGIVYIRPQGDAVNTGQVMFNGNNTSQYTDNHNILFGTQTTVGASVFHTNVANTTYGYGAWMAYNLQFNGTDFIQPRGTGVSTYAFTANQHKGFSFNYAGPTGANGSVVALTEVVRFGNTGTITTLNDGTSAQWKAAYDTSLNAVTTNTVQNIIATKTFTVMQKLREGGLKFFEGNTLSPYLNKYENKAVYGPTASSATGNLKITFPFTTQATMWSLKVKVLQYAAASTNTKTVQLPMTITVTGYNVTAGSANVNWGASGNNFHNNFVGVRIGYDATTNNKIVWLDFTGTLNYPKVIIEEIITHHAGSANAALDGTWDLQFTTDETNYTHQNTILLADFKELVTEAKILTWDAAGAEVGNNLKILGNGVGKHNLLGIDAFTIRNSSQWAGGANRPVNTNSAVVNFTPYSSGGSTYGFSLGSRNNRLFFVTEEASVFGSWLEIYHTGNIATAPVITSNTTQTGLTGDKTTSGNWVFNGTGATGITLLRPGSAINNSMAFGFDSATHYVGLADPNTFAIGINANLAESNRKLWVDTVNNTLNIRPNGGSNLGARDIAGLTITTPTNNSRAEMIVRHVWTANNKTFALGGVSSATAGSMSTWGMFRWLNDRTVNGNDGFFGWTGDGDNLMATSLAGTGTRMVVAGSGGGLSTQAIPTGTVTSVGMTVPTGLIVTGSPITTSGSLDVTFQSGYSIPTDANQTNWSNAFNFTSNFATNNPNLTAIEALSGINGYLRKTGPGTWELVTSPVGIATSTNAGIVKLFSDTVQSVAANAVSATNLRTYGVQFNSAGQMVVNVPWTDTIYSLAPATSTSIGGIKLASDTVQSVPIESISTTAKRTYGLQVNNNGQGVINVPWTDTVYTHPTSGVAAGTYRSVTVNTLGHVTAGTNPTTLAGYGITDAMSTSHPANSITSPMISSWNSSAAQAHSHSNKPLLDLINQDLSTNTSPHFNGVWLNDNLGYGETIFGEDNIGGESGIVNVNNSVLYAAREDIYLKYGATIGDANGIVVNLESRFVGIGKLPGDEQLEVKGRVKSDHGFIHGSYNSPNYGLASDGSVFDISSLVPQQNSQVKAINTGADIVITPVGHLTVVQLIDGTGGAPNGKIVLPTNATVGQEVICINISSNNAAVYQAGNPMGLIGLGAGYQLRCNFVLDGGPSTVVGGTGAGKWIVGNISMTNHIL